MKEQVKTILDDHDEIIKCLATANQKIEKLIGRMFLEGYCSIPTLNGGHLKRKRLIYINESIYEISEMIELGVKETRA